jgi:hypothetical protein
MARNGAGTSLSVAQKIAPKTIVKVTSGVALRGSTAGACVATGPAVAVCAAATVACILYCDDAIDWVWNRVQGELGGKGTLNNGPVYLSRYPDSAAGPFTCMASGVGQMCSGTDVSRPFGVKHVLGEWSRVSGQTICKKASDGTFYALLEHWKAVLRNDESFPEPGFGICTTTGDKIMAQRIYVGDTYDIANPFLIWEAVITQKTGRLDVTCKAPDGSTFTASSAPFAYTSGERKSLPARPSCESVIPNSTTQKITIVGSPSVGAATFPETLGTVTVDPALYPNCSGGGCILQVTYQGQPCVPGSASCNALASQVAAAPADYACKWGAYTMPMSDCAVLYEYYVESETQPTATPSPSASATTGTGTGTTSMPTTGANPTAPPTSVEETTDPNSQSCYAAAWSWNPIDWVLVPVKCALKWAFVPPSGAWAAAMGPPLTTWQESPFGQWGSSAGDVIGSLAGFDDQAAGCAGPSLSSNVGGVAYDFAPLNACTQPMARVAEVTKILLTLIVAFGGAFLILDPITSAFGISLRPRSEETSLA